MALTLEQRRAKSIISRFKKEVAKRKMRERVPPPTPSPVTPKPPQPGDPTFVGPPVPTKPEPTPEPSPEEIQKVEQEMESLKGKPVVVTYRTPSGEVRRVQTTRFGKDYRIPGEFISVSPLQPSGGAGRAVLVGTGDVTGPSLIARQRESYYQKGVPGWATEQVKVPSKIGKVGVGGLYQDISYRRFLGLDTAKQEKELETKMRSSRWYMGSQVKYAGGKTFEELKAEEPALYLKPDVYGMLTPEYDVKRWRTELHNEMNKTFGGSIAEGAKVISSSFLNIFDLNYWFAEDRAQYIYEKEYGHMKQIKKGDALGVWAGSQIPAYTTVILPMAAGAGFAAAFGRVGAAGAATAGTTGRALTGFATYGPWVAGGTILSVVGTDIGLTAAKQQTGDWVKDWTSRETLKKATTYGIQFASAGAGYKWAAGYKPTYGVAEGPGKTLVWQKHLTTIGGKPILPYGKPVVFGKIPSGGIGRVVSPFPSKGGLRFKTPKGFLKDTIGMGPKPKWPFVPSGLSKAPTIYSHPPMGKPVPIVKYKGRYSFITGKGWQPKTGFRYLPSTKVWPKPLPHPRAYEHHFFTMVFAPKPIVSFKTKPIGMKPFKPKVFTAKDILKPDTAISKGIVSGTGRQQTILKPPKTVTVTKTTTQTKQIVSPISKDVVVPESLLKPVYKTTKMQLQKPKMKMFKGLEQIYKTKHVQVQKRTSQLLFGLSQKQSQSFKQLEKQLSKQKYAQMFSFSQMQLQLQKQLQGTVQLQGFAQRYRYDMVPEYVQTYKTVTPKTQPSPVLPSPTFTHPTPKKPPTRRPKIIRLPDFRGAGRQPTKKKLEGGFAPFLKKSQYSNEYIRADRRAYSQKDAFALGSHLVDQSAAASFKVQQVTGKPKRLKHRVAPWSMLSGKFYQKGDRNIEYTTYRIDSPGEIRQISWQGHLAQMQRSRPKSRPKQSKKQQTVTFDNNIIDMREFNRMFKRMRLI